MNKKWKLINVVLFIMCILFMLAFLTLWWHGGYTEKLINKLTNTKSENIDWTLESWKSSLAYLEYNADIAFIGDSITIGHNFQNDFPDKKIINLGISGDTLKGINNRIDMLSYVNPEKVFIMGGINGFKDNNINEQLDIYKDIITRIKDDLPNTKIYILSTLPVTNDLVKKDNRRSNDGIYKFNLQLSDICKNSCVTFIDLYSLYIKDGELNPELTVDGVHLTNDGYMYWINEITSYVYE